MGILTVIILIMVSVLSLFLLWALYENSQDQIEINLRLIDIQETIDKIRKSPSDTLVPISFLLDLYRHKVVSMFEFRLYLEQFYGFDLDAAVIPEMDVYDPSGPKSSGEEGTD